MRREGDGGRVRWGVRWQSDEAGRGVVVKERRGVICKSSIAHAAVPNRKRDTEKMCYAEGGL